MRSTLPLTLAAALLALPALGQDSTSLSPADGDAVWCWDTAEQTNTFIVDLEPFQSSWNNGFAIAPLIKSSKTSGTYLNSLISAQAASNTILVDMPIPFGEYSLWNAPGFGINDFYNTPGTPINTSFDTNQIALAFAEFGTSPSGFDANSIAGALVNWEPAEPMRLYVARINAAVNGHNWGENRAQFGFGGVDAGGNVHFRADGYGTTGPNAITGNNYFRVDLPGRNAGALNVIDNSGGSDGGATDWIVQQSGTTHNTPNIIPQDFAGRPVLIGSNFNGEYVYEQSAGSTTTTTAHRPGTSDQRGGVCYTHRLSCAAISIGTAAILGLDSSFDSKIISVWDVDPNGNVGGPTTLTLPTAGFSGFSTNVEFGHYHSQTAYRGGNGQIALGRDRNGYGLAAAVIYDMNYSPPSGVYDWPDNAIAVARFDCTGSQEWTLAAAIPASGGGTPILDGPGGTAIGELAHLYDVTGGSPYGPSMSAPTMDSAGNIFFIASCEIPPQSGEFTNALLRAVYDPDDFSYELELLFKLGQVFHGQNSDTDYQISFLTIADGNSVNSGTMWSGNIVQTAFNGLPEPANSADPRNLGGLIINAEITYDINGDGQFDEDDEQYSVILYVTADGNAGLKGDLNCDGLIDAFDIDPFVLALINPAGYQAAWPDCDINNADINNDGLIDSFDIDPFVDLLTGP